MGLNHTFQIHFSAARLPAVARYCADNTKDLEGKPPMAQPGETGSVSILVPVDRFIKRYFREYYHGPFEFRDSSVLDFMVGDRCRIGGFDFRIYAVTPEVFSIEFTCVSSDMSRLCDDSPGVRAWFVQLCRAAQASFGMYHRDNYYYEVIWWENAERCLRISDHIYNLGEAGLDILADFYPLAFDSWYNTLDQ